MPDGFPIPAYAVSNPIYLDKDGNGMYDAPLPMPAFCSVSCDPNGASSCPDGQLCIAGDLDPTKGACGYPVDPSYACTYRHRWSGGL